jgi:hypothetical protein
MLFNLLLYIKYLLLLLKLKCIFVFKFKYMQYLHISDHLFRIENYDLDTQNKMALFTSSDMLLKQKIMEGKGDFIFFDRSLSSFHVFDGEYQNTTRVKINRRFFDSSFQVLIRFMCMYTNDPRQSYVFDPPSSLVSACRLFIRKDVINSIKNEL